MKRFHFMFEDIATVLERDPAARSRFEVAVCYSGLHALWIHKVSHWLWQHNAHASARILSQAARFLTGIEIHPAARIGRRLFIDHGMGVVIGETSVVGDDVTIYQNATLGGTGKETGKRHPTIGNNVMIGAGAKILGNIAIGENCWIGAGSVVLRSVPANSTVVGVPARVVYRNGIRVVITDPKEISDPLSDVLKPLLQEVQALREEIEILKAGESDQYLSTASSLRS